MKPICKSARYGKRLVPLVLLLAVTATAEEIPPREAVAELLKEARAAIAANDLANAQKLVAEAEAQDVRFTVFDAGDTPAKVRKDLEMAQRRLYGASGTASARMPSLPFGGRLGQPQNTTSDPFLGRSSPPAMRAAAPRGVAGAAAPRGPTVAAGPRYPATGAPPATANDARSQSDRALLAARRALAVGDARRAEEQLQTAKKLGVQYQFHEDSPANVEAALRKYNDVMGRREGRADTESWRRQYAEVLMEQADAMLRWKDFDEAERLANTAVDQRVTYAPFEANPQALLARVTKERQAVGGARPVPRATLTPRATAAAPNSPPPASNSVPSGNVVPPNPAADPRQAQVNGLVGQAREALKNGDVARAEQLAQQAQDIGLPDSAFAQGEDRPWLVLLDVQKQKGAAAGNRVVLAGGDSADDDRYAKQGVYTPEHDRTYNRTASSDAPRTAQRSVGEQAQPEPPPARFITDQEVEPADASGITLFNKGEQALRSGDKAAALNYFRAAQAKVNELDGATRSRLQTYLQTLSISVVGEGGTTGGTLIESAAQRQQLLARKLAGEVAKFQSDSRRLRTSDPKQAIDMLAQGRQMVNDSEADPATKEQLLRRLDLSDKELEKYIEQNRAQIELDQRNKEVLEEVDRRRWERVERQEKIAELVEQYNKLVDEQRYAEAEIVVKRAYELAPDEPVVRQLWINARQHRRMINQQLLVDARERGFFDQLDSVDHAAVGFDDRNPIDYGDATEWAQLTKRRSEMLRNARSRRSERELEIERKLKTPVSLKFSQTPLGEVMDHLARLTGVNVHLDPRGLAEEGVTSNTPIDISLNQEVSLKSALNLILEPLHLSYVIKDEVLKITSEQLRDGEVYTQTYNVADLVIPIPNFVPGGQIGLSGQLQQAYSALGYGGAGGAAPVSVVAGGNGGNGSGVIHPAVLANMSQSMGARSPVPGPMAGPGGLGGGVEPDFDALIELITGTIQPNTWDAVGGPGSVKEFETNLSLVVSQTQDVHEELVDLLEQLRRLQDLQVTIEVRFITLSDNFFERIGVQFDFNIEDNDTRTSAQLAATDSFSPSTVVGQLMGIGGQGMDNAGNPIGGFTADLDIPFRQGGFAAAVPAFGGFDPAQAATFGFAILSDIEAFFLVNAAQGDSRSNILEAPKVTLFNGQQAFVSDTTQVPFVISVIPVVGDFAAAQQPVIVVLSEGTFLSVQAVVSNDRRYVRLTVVPFFSQIGDVREFTFEGSSNTTNETSEDETVDDNQVRRTTNNSNVRRQGTTVQLPEFSFVTVTTTVSVPDGGTVLLGGIKRLSEQRNETGVPLLSKVPYINRLFRNIGIGRETASLMMMVTPRIIIQEEEEEIRGISAP